MKVDNVILDILEEIKKEVKEKYNVDISIQEILNIIKSQLEATKIGFSRLVPIHWIGFGKFIFTNKKNRKYDVIETCNKIDSIDYDMTAQEREELKKKFIIEKAKERENLLKEGHNAKSITANELFDKSTNLNPKIVSFTNIMKKRK